MDTNQIDYSGVLPTPAAKPTTWKAPRHVYFGPKDPETGQMADEPVYAHQDYPRHMYAAKDGGGVRAIQVNSKDEEDALGEEWHYSPAKFGVLTAPSIEQLQAAKLAAAVKPVAVTKETE
jgi:hypothetical protein